jgi:initiation factor 1A
MPKNLTGGNKAKKGKNSSLREFTRKLDIPDNSGYQYYGLVIKHHGSTTDIVYLDTRKPAVKSTINERPKLTKVIGCRRGKIGRRGLNINDITIVCIRDYQEDRVDIIHIYNEDEVKELKKNNYLDEAFLELMKANDAGVDVCDKGDDNTINDENIHFDETFMNSSEDEYNDI